VTFGRYIEPGSPWENSYCESFNACFRDELLNGEVFYSLKEAQIIIEQWRRFYKTPALGPGLPPALAGILHSVAGNDAHALRFKLDQSQGLISASFEPTK